MGKMEKLFSKIFFFLIVFVLFFSTTIYSQNKLSGGDGEKEGNFKFLPVPYINYNRSIGLSLGALPMAMFKPVKDDALSPTSIAALLGIYATNKTWFIMGFTKIHFDEDNWRLALAGGLGSLNFQFYLDNPINSWIPYNTSLNFAMLEVQRRIYDKFYLGLSYIYLKFKTKTDLTPESETDKLKGLGFKLTMDKRENIYYPKQGNHSNLKFFTYPKAFGNKSASNKIELDYNHYFPIREDHDVIATRFLVGLGLGDLSFNQQFIVGQKDVRGYTQGAFRGNYLVSIQGEYRWNFANRWGLVGFIGFATIFEATNAENDGRILPGIGTGIRFTAFEDNHMNVGLDIAAGDGDWGLYFRIGEAF